jgi:hypothetical protein
MSSATRLEAASEQTPPPSPRPPQSSLYARAVWRDNTAHEGALCSLQGRFAFDRAEGHAERYIERPPYPRSSSVSARASAQGRCEHAQFICVYTLGCC